MQSMACDDVAWHGMTWQEVQSAGKLRIAALPYVTLNVTNKRTLWTLLTIPTLLHRVT